MTVPSWRGRDPNRDCESEGCEGADTCIHCDAEMIDFPEEVDAAEARANARLIAAAPDLLAALHHISLASQNSMSSKEECGRIAREAIAKATKEKP